jgi:hypothetical protein
MTNLNKYVHSYNTLLIKPKVYMDQWANSYHTLEATEWPVQAGMWSKSHHALNWHGCQQWIQAPHKDGLAKNLYIKSERLTLS